MSDTPTQLNGAMPPKIAAAIAQVMAGVPKLARGERNTHGNYNFASIDDFLEAVRPLCAAAGLIILQDEAASEMLDGGVDKFGKSKRWLSITYSFTLVHSSGETWERRPTRSIVVDASMGSQAFGAAQSYCLKLFQRSLFQIATGEKGQDVDEHAPIDLPQRSQMKRKSSAQAKRDGDWPTLERALLDTQSAREVERLREEWRRDWYPTWKQDWRDAAEEEFDKRQAMFSSSDLAQTLKDSLDQPPYQKATPEQIATFKECQEELDAARDAAELKHRATNAGYQNGFALLTRQQQDTLRVYYTTRLDGFKAAVQ